MDINKKKEIDYKSHWHFFCRELAKINNIIYAYDKIFLNIETKNSCYSEFFELVLNSFAKQIIVNLDLFFQKRKDVWSLYKFDKIDKKKINNIKKITESYIIMRNNKTAHLSDKINHKNNFELLTLKGINEIKKIAKELEEILTEVSSLYNFKEQYIFNWQGINHSLDCLIEDIKKVK